MAKRPTLLEHFRSFSYQNNISDFETALEYFTVFGGTGWDVDVSKSVDVLIEEKILSNYESIHNRIIRFTHGNALYHMLLSIIALGEEHEDAVFKKGSVGKEKGQKAIDYLVMKSLLKFDHSVEKPLEEGDSKSDRLVFELPFMRFWFGFISANYKGIVAGDFREFYTKWHNVKAHFSILISNLLVRDLVHKSFKNSFKNDPIVALGSYYDKNVNIDILAKRKSGKMLVGACKYSKEAAKINTLNTLQKMCEKAQLKISEYILFSKNGFTLEFTGVKDDNLILLEQTHMSFLLENLNKKDLLDYSNKKY